MDVVFLLKQALAHVVAERSLPPTPLLKDLISKVRLLDGINERLRKGRRGNSGWSDVFEKSVDRRDAPSTSSVQKPPLSLPLLLLLLLPLLLPLLLFFFARAPASFLNPLTKKP